MSEEINKEIHEKIMGAKWYARTPEQVERYPHLQGLKWLYTDDQVGSILRQKIVQLADGDETPDELEAIPRYSTDISKAWKVVEKMREKGFDWVVGSNWGPNSHKPLEVYCTFGNDAGSFTGISDNPAEAICLAVLGAVK